MYYLKSVVMILFVACIGVSTAQCRAGDVASIWQDKSSPPAEGSSPGKVPDKQEPEKSEPAKPNQEKSDQEKSNNPKADKPAKAATPKKKEEAKQQDGSADLEAAVELKEAATSTRDLDKVVDLCKSALKKGLDESSKSLAEGLMKSTLQDQIQQLMERIEGGDTRWRFLRREALNRLDTLLEVDPKLAQAHLQMARLCLQPDGDEEKGRAAIDKAIEFAGTDKKTLAEALLLRAAIAPDEDSKIADLNQAIIFDPTNLKARLAHGQYYIEHQKVDQAIDDFKTLMDTSETINPQFLILVAEQLLQNDRADDALQFVNKAIDTKPDDFNALKLRGDIYARLYRHADARQDRNRAIEILDQALDSRSDNVSLLLAKAQLQMDIPDMEGALKTLNDALKADDTSMNVLLIRSLVNSQLNHDDEAIADITKVLDRVSDPDHRFRLQLAAYYTAAKKTDEANKIYDKIVDETEKLLKDAVDANNDDAAELFRSTLARTLRGRADSYSSVDNWKQAVADYERAIDLEKDTAGGVDAGTLNNLAWLLATGIEPEGRDGARRSSWRCRQTKRQNTASRMR